VIAVVPQQMHETMWSEGGGAMNASDDLPGPVSAADHVRGAHDALVTIIEYGDFECPSCKQAAPAVLLLVRRFHGAVRLVFRHFPLEEVHANALTAAEASEAAAAQGRFWEMHDQLFDHQHRLQRAHLRQLAKAVGLDLRRFSTELKERIHVPRIRQNAAEGRRLGIRATPTFYVNGALCDVSFGLLALRRAVEKAVDRAADSSRALRTAHQDADVGDLSTMTK
jgi:protein-disulfide isomerase